MQMFYFENLISSGNSDVLLKKKLQLSAEDFIKRTPIISADGGVMLGSKNTTVFLVDAKPGTIIFVFRLIDHSAIGDQNARKKQSYRKMILKSGWGPLQWTFRKLNSPFMLPAVHQNKEGKAVLALPPPQTEDFGILTLPLGEFGQIYTSVVPEILAAFWRKDKLKKQSEDEVQAVMSRKKKARKSGINKNGAGIETNGLRIGKLFVSNREIAKGSNGTVVLKGIYDGHPVAV
ncbi:endoribonuclease/protein kinase IRE1-like protein [Actinidia rufa]|uniref:Endoribonuclease/protein kinase IRE1-like protein n=1 Tax=Actinidia rufa TaxID=165716 RepID=A0A7J0EIV0_9ERIC|nr:endoribonuclease/protein kinase IRE1-like protein [Actinidia rufa]